MFQQPFNSFCFGLIKNYDLVRMTARSYYLARMVTLMSPLRPKILLLTAALIFCSGCFSVQVERQTAAGETRRLKQNFFLLGRIGEPEINLTEECPSGVSSFGDTFTWSDVLIGIVTIGIYTPRTVVIKCAA